CWTRSRSGHTRPAKRPSRGGTKRAGGGRGLKKGRRTPLSSCPRSTKRLSDRLRPGRDSRFAQECPSAPVGSGHVAWFCRLASGMHRRGGRAAPADLSLSLGSDPIAQIGEPSRESPFLDQFEISAQPCRQGLLLPSDEDRHHEESDLVYQPLGQRVAGEFRSADGDVGAGVFFHLLDRGRVELALDAGLLARYIFQRSREDDLLRRSPDLGVVF